jgi:hypothetical protein
MKEYPCELCGKKFSQKCNWVQHTKNKKFPCVKKSDTINENLSFSSFNPPNQLISSLNSSQTSSQTSFNPPNQLISSINSSINSSIPSSQSGVDMSYIKILVKLFVVIIS